MNQIEKYIGVPIVKVIIGWVLRTNRNDSLGNHTVLHYLQYAQDVFLLNKVYSCDPVSKKYFEIYNKYYVSDLWLRNSIVWYDFKRDIGSLIENYVYLELKRKKYEVKVWRFSNEKEIDFIAEKWWRKIYLQVAYTMKTENTLTREYASLKLLKDNWAKYVVTLDSHQIWPHEGIEHIYMLDLEDVLL
jgi:predicted AAA+ superfamily ATPase